MGGGGSGRGFQGRGRGKGRRCTAPVTKRCNWLVMRGGCIFPEV